MCNAERYHNGQQPPALARARGLWRHRLYVRAPGRAQQGVEVWEGPHTGLGVGVGVAWSGDRSVKRPHLLNGCSAGGAQNVQQTGTSLGFLGG